MVAVSTIVVDYGGVLTNPLAETLSTFAEQAGVSTTIIGTALAKAELRHGEPPMAALETARITEAEFVERLTAELDTHRRTRVLNLLAGRTFGEVWFRGRRPNTPFLEFLGDLRARGYRLAMLTNNVREWEPRWRAQLPAGDFFDTIVDSSREGVRKPQPDIYRILLDRLAVPPADCLFVDDLAANCAAAKAAGMHTIQFTGTGATRYAIARFLDLRQHPEVVDA